MDNVRSIFLEQSVERREEFSRCAPAVCNAYKFYIRAHDTGAKRRVTFVQSNNDMPKLFAIRAVDEIRRHHFQPAHRKAEDHMDDQESPFLIRRVSLLNRPGGGRNLGDQRHRRWPAERPVGQRWRVSSPVAHVPRRMRKYRMPLQTFQNQQGPLARWSLVTSWPLIQVARPQFTSSRRSSRLTCALPTSG